MDSDVRNRKNKKAKKDDKNISEQRASGDGESEPSSPPPEQNGSLKTNGAVKSKNEKKSKETKSPSVSFDAISVILFVLAFSTRAWKLSSPNAVVFDELHYAKYAALYAKNTFFFDSQPPLGKQILALAGHYAGFNSDFKFDRIGAEYDNTVPIVALRLVPCLFSAFLMPTIYSLLIELGLSSYSGALACFLLIFDNAVLIQTRYVLMESFLLFFGFFGLLCVLRFRRYSSRPYSLPWFTYLILAATSLTAAFCVRYFGGFTLVLGLVILTKDYWMVLVPNKTISDMQLLLHLFTRFFVFSAIFVGIYVGVFYVHVTHLYKAGPNDNIMTSAYQASLEGGLASIVANQPLEVIHGSQITLRHTHGRTCWLHSHEAVYPVQYSDDRGSSHQQQVTCYSYKDVNNWWIVKKPEIEELVVSEPHVPIRHGDVIQLVHGLTSRALNSHDVASAMSPHSQEVSCYIDYNISMPAQTLWKVDLLNKDSTNGFWHALDSEVRLIHFNTSTALKFSGRQLPEWGFKQHEVVAEKVIEQEDTIWNVEEHRYSKTDDQQEREKELIRYEMIPTARRNLSFWEKFIELQYKMIYNNQENVAGHMYASDPLDWPLLKRGVAYWISSTSNAQIHFIGNIVTWLCGTLSILAYLAIFVFYLLRRARNFYDIPEDAWTSLCTVGEVLVTGYFLHYIPYFLVDRTLFLHHYIPAYVFKVCVLASVIDHIYYIFSKVFKSRILSWLYILAVLSWMALVFYCFYKFSPVTYGNVDLKAEEVNDLSLFDTWDLIVHKFEEE